MNNTENNISANKRVLLMILDGWGIAQDKTVSAIDAAKTPFVDSLYSNYPNSKLRTDGEFVGLPKGQMGNSEVGHMNIGAGRVVYQNLARINVAVENNELVKNETLQNAFKYAKENNVKLHFMGLISEGGVHSHSSHLKALTTLATQAGLKDIFIHGFTDGRDTDPNSGEEFLIDLENHLKTTNAKIASLVGRYYAMDRDKRWERIKLSYDAMVKAEGKKVKSAVLAVKESYNEGVTDEFLQPIIMTDENGAPLAKIEKGDVVIAFNFRTDRCREITQALCQQDFEEQEMKKMNLYYVTMTNYNKSFENVKIVFEDINLTNTLGDVLEKNNKTQLRAAETEKYPHVTFFFSGGREKEFEGENRIMCASPKVATYDLQPEMSAFELKDKVINDLNQKKPDFVCLNFANPDMVGHTGIFEAAIKACETVDFCAKEVSEAALKNNYQIIIIADHGNADKMKNEDGTPNTAHTTNEVPMFLLSNEELKNNYTLKNGKLGDIATTILKLMNVEIPEEMTGEVLV
ncbi:phosphoglycerate mutase [Bernardetia litoralis DSM 6794]|uniref:2,3-bisphosphoglycerate-independent phosphoglycerate mutase n=1 Tax=Bernardetia litoralis (strain ATCC 23117 / DSM 6794 / NBRC 15988 / NCIMB 1366 / Fx l1 / Sio-4) TaxID=880071 RepID=I4ANA2_BERLS|nr:2,3-bisphosphoglycerate-independent phosphoglycerate mutase [Bernardetia litoralis]AFM05437.1 phosphoglycerate mutase [Bernardetia litoralis DSM 6794]